MSNFENDIKNVFESAEFAPSDKVWAGVEAAIAPKRKKGFFFMWQTYGVAAGLVLVLSFSFLYRSGVLDTKNDAPGQELSNQNENSKEEENTAGDDDKEEEKKNQDIGDGIEKKNLASLSKGSKVETKENGVQKDQNQVNDKIPMGSIKKERDDFDRRTMASVKESNQNENVDASDALLSSPDFLFNVKNLSDALSLNKIVELRPYLKSLASEKLIWNSRLNLVSMSEISKETLVASIENNQPTREKSINGSFGNNILNLSSTADNLSLSTAALRDPSTNFAVSGTVDNSEDEVQGAISAGFGVSFEISDKLNLNVGLRYSEFRFRSAANAYSVENGESLPIYIPAGFDDQSVFFVGDYNLTNTIQSLFVQATVGYKIVTVGKFNVAVQAGFGLDYFLSYKIKGDLNFLSTRKVTPGENGFLTRTNLSGVSGLVFNYRLNNQFGIGADFTYRKFLAERETTNNPSSVIGFGLSLNYFLTRKK